MEEAPIRYSAQEVAQAVRAGTELASGGSGTVFQCFLRGQPVAIKRLAWVSLSVTNFLAL